VSQRFPACWHGQVTVTGSDHIIWVTRGKARVGVLGRELVLREGQAVRIPTGGTVEFVSTDQGSVATSVLVTESDPLLSRARRGTVLQLREEEVLCLLLRFSDWIVPHLKSDVEERRPGLGEDPFFGDLLMPSSPALRQWAEKVLQDPADRRTLSGWAEEFGLSGSQLSRRCLSETGLSWRAWELKARLLRSWRLMDGGMSVGDAALAVGYSSTSSFSKAFLREYGYPPSGRAALKRASYVVDGGSETIFNRRVNYGVYPRVNKRHVLLWQVNGNSTVSMGDIGITICNGEVLWVPAGVWHSITFSRDGIMIPVGEAKSEYLLRQHHMAPRKVSPDMADELLFHATVNYTILRPWPHDPENMKHLLPFGGLKRVFAPAIDEVLSAGCLDQRSLADWSSLLGISVKSLSRQFSMENGVSFVEWKTGQRMNIARYHLAGTSRPIADIAHRVGYSEVSSFSRSFSRIHGMTPTAFRRRHSRRAIVELPQTS
jgi:AraC-like DNA-binding protein/quercetin dioxygenase-like cupin family protein